MSPARTGLALRAKREPETVAEELTRGLIVCSWDMSRLAEEYCVSRDTMRRLVARLGLADQQATHGRRGKAEAVRREWERWRSGLCPEDQELIDCRVRGFIESGYSPAMARKRARLGMLAKIKREEKKMRFFAVFEDGSRVELTSKTLADAEAEAREIGAVGVSGAK